MGLLDGNMVNGDSDAPNKEELDGTSGFDSKLDGTEEGSLDGMSDLDHVGEDEDATVGTLKGLFVTAWWTWEGLSDATLVDGNWDGSIEGKPDTSGFDAA
jgi:hypothetical protein